MTQRIGETKKEYSKRRAIAYFLKKRSIKNAKYYQEHKKEMNINHKAYLITENGKQAHKKGQKKYQKTEKGKLSVKKAQEKYFKTQKGKELQRKKDALRKVLGFLPINPSFEGNNGHHLTKKLLFIYLLSSIEVYLIISLRVKV